MDIWHKIIETEAFARNGILKKRKVAAPRLIDLSTLSLMLSFNSVTPESKSSITASAAREKYTYQ